MEALMCAPKASNSAQAQAAAEADEARRREEERQGRLREGRANIDAAYSGFDDDYYNRYRQAALDTTLPQVQTQAGDARRDLVFALSNAGTRNSSIAADKGGRLERDIAMREGEARSQADDAARQLRGTVNDSRAQAERDLMLVEDPTRAANDALARSQVLRSTQPAPSMIGPLFESAALGYGAYQQGKRQVASDAMAARLLNNLDQASRTGG
jgi:hypothetical protein